MSHEAYYLKHVPAQVQALSARLSDGALLMAWEAVNKAHNESPNEPANIPGVGIVQPAELHTVWGWVLDVVKSRHCDEWEARNEADYAEITAKAAAMQGVAPEVVDWDAVPDDLFDGKASALDHAVLVLSEHAARDLLAVTA